MPSSSDSTITGQGKPSLRTRLFSLSSRKDSKPESMPSETGKGNIVPTVTVDDSAASPEPATAAVEDLVRQSSSSAHPVQTAESLSESPESRIDRDHTADVPEGSVNTSATLSGHASSPPATTKPHRTPFYRRKTTTKSTSVKVNGATNDKPKSVSTGHLKPSLLSRVVHKVVPCVGPSPRSHRVELDNMDVDAATPRASWKEAPGTDSKTDSSTAERNIQTPPALTLPLMPSTTPQHSPVPSPTDSEVIVPPPPSAHLLPEDETDGVTSGAVQPPGSTGLDVINIARSHTNASDSSSDGYEGTDVDMDTDDEADQDRHTLDEQADEERLIRRGGNGIPVGPNGELRPLLPPVLPQHVGKKCLVLDLDETLVHSSFKPTPQPADFVVPVEIEYHWHHFHVLKRPGVDDFMKRMGELYEVVVFTASLSKYADPVLDILDIHHVVAHRLFRESCYSHKGNYVKDLSQLGRPIADTIILDNSPASYVFHPTSAVPVSSWFNDPHDAELTDLVPFLADLANVDLDVRQILDGAI